MSLRQFPNINIHWSLFASHTSHTLIIYTNRCRALQQGRFIHNLQLLCDWVYWEWVWCIGRNRLFDFVFGDIHLQTHWVEHHSWCMCQLTVIIGSVPNLCKLWQIICCVHGVRVKERERERERLYGRWNQVNVKKRWWRGYGV
jgi:hypothetical protein